jgi:phage baseplate assembly protein W
MRFINIKFPLRDDVEKNKAFKMNTVTKEALTSNLLLLLLTKKGERYYEPNYGTNLIQYIFEPKDNLTITEIEAEIKETVKSFIPEVSISKIEFFEDVDNVGNKLKDNELRVTIDFTYTEDTFIEKGKLELNF